MNKRPRIRFRPLHGLLLLDKPSGLSSSQALQEVRKLFRAEKGGHTGALDPLATGLLPLCFGEATKIAGLLLGAQKAYDTIAVLGVTTDSDDADGEVLQQRIVPELAAETVEAALQPLRGDIRQRAPIFSALKQGGERLYAKARRGEAIEAPERDVSVESFELLGMERGADGELRLHLRAVCGSGTYVRSLVRDLGESLGCGAHVATLRRLWVEPFAEPVMHTLDELRELAGQGEPVLDGCLQPIEAGLVAYPRVAIDPEQAVQLGYGQFVQLPAGSEPQELVTVHACDDQLLGLGSIDETGLLRPRRLFTWASSEKP